MCVCVPHGDMGVVSNHLLRQHLHMDVCVVELFPHLPQLTHGIVQIAFALTPAGHIGRKFNISMKILVTQLSFCSSSPSNPSCSPQTCSGG